MATAAQAGPLQHTSPRSIRWPGPGLTSGALTLAKVVVSVVGTIAIWEALRAARVLPPAAVPSSWDIARVFIDNDGRSTLLSALGKTLRAWAFGLCVACVLGVAAGLGIGVSQWAHASTKGIIDFVRPIPSVALVPVALVFLGFGFRMEVALVVIGAIWPVIFNTRYGVQSVDPLWLDSGRALGLGPWDRICRIRLVGALPGILSGVRTASAIALTLTVSAEALAVPSGLGYVISSSSQTGKTADAYAAIVLTGLVGVTVNLLLEAVRRQVIHWNLRPEK